MDQDTGWSRTRIAMTLVGAAGGWSAWWLFERLPDMLHNERVVLFVTMTVLGFFLEVMALAGPVRLRVSALPALGLSVAIAALTLWASVRYGDLDAFLEAEHIFAAPFVIYVVATPFLSVMLEKGPVGWRDYASLFQTAWSVIVRFAAAAGFTAVFWGVLMLCDGLLDLVGITLINDLLEIDGAPFVISGAVAGLALAVAHEWRAYVSPHLLLRLLRLLVPMTVPVLALFLLAVSLAGTEDVLGGLSSTSLLMSVALGAITLVTVSVDRDATHQAQAWPMRWGVQAMALMILPVAGLAAAGIRARVAEKGWIPGDLLAALVVGMALLYALAYLVAVLRRGDWPVRIRRANIGLALLTLVLAVLWLTPALNAERLSARSQVDRLLAGTIDPARAEIWDLVHRWGIAGQRAAALLRETPDYPARDRVLALLERAEAASDRYAFDPDRTGEDLVQKQAELAARLPLMPAGTTLPEGALNGLTMWEVTNALEACDLTYEDGTPGCLYLEVPFYPDQPERQGVLFLRMTEQTVTTFVFTLQDGQLTQKGRLTNLPDRQFGNIEASLLPVIRAGGYQIAPAPVNVLNIGGYTLFPVN